MISGFLTPSHIAILLVVAPLILGPTQLPSAGRVLASVLREFKHSIAGHSSDAPTHNSRLPTSPSSSVPPSSGG
jgi:Sec-independent protein translocase protein TatA